MKLSTALPLSVLVTALALAGCGSGSGAGAGVSPTATPVAAPSAAIAASQTTVASGGTSTLTWNAANVDSCSASDGWTGTVPTSGSQDTAALTADTNFTLTCQRADGASTVASVKIAIAKLPTVTLTAAPTDVASGASSTLSWSSTDATSCAASGGWTGSLAPSGTHSTGALTASTGYSLICSGLGGASPATTVTVSVTAAPVNPAPTVTLTAAPTAVARGAASTLTWTSTNATECKASGAWTGLLASTGSKSSGAVTLNSTFSLQCTGPGGTSAVATAAVNVIPTATLSANPLSVASGAASTLTWSSANATACTATGGWAGALATAGTQSTGALTATKTYSLTCNGAGGNSATANVTVTISNGTLGMAPKTASLTVTQNQQFTATLAGGAAANWSVDGVSGGNATIGLISASGLYMAPATIAGTHAHTILATSVTDGSTAVASVAITDLAGVYTYHNNDSRDGVNAQEYALTTATVKTASFGIIAKCPVDGAVYAQPLWVANLTVAGARHNVVLVATEHDSLYAFDADSNSCTATGPLWHANLIDTNHGAVAGEIPVPTSFTNSGYPSWVGAGYGDLSPEVGITGTPVIDPKTNTLYVVTKSSTNTATDISLASCKKSLHCVQRLHAIDIATGNEKAGSPIVIAGTYPGTGDGNGTTTVTFNSGQELQRTGLALVNSTVYVAFTAHEDNKPWYGWMMSYSYGGGGFTQTAVINVAPTKQKSGIWMSGGAPAVDTDKNTLYALTGNGDFDVTGNGSAPNNDYGDSLVQFSAKDLSIQQYFTPANQDQFNNADLDFGAGGATVMADLPGSTVVHALICGGKDGNMYVLNRAMLGSYGDGVAGNTVEVQKFALSNGRLFATGSIWENTFYISAAGGPVESWTLNTATTKFTAASKSTVPAGGFGGKGATPSVSASATQNGIVWALNAAAYCTHQAGSCAPTGVYAYDATNLTTMLWNSTQVAADAAGYPVKFAVPTIANGKVYVGTRGNNVGAPYNSTSVNGELDIYGLKP